MRLPGRRILPLHRVLPLLAHRRTIKPFAILLTILSAAVTYFIAKYGVAIDSSMVQNTVHTDPTEVRSSCPFR